ncbi:DUF4476 domain-containing protein [candidate division WOR-3 bacterium]|nr:DUF4476 domain-containing protein [candidate division WOR-3 bacterium]
MWTSVVLFMLISVYPGEVMINGPEGAVSIVLPDQGQYIADQGHMTIGAVLASVNVRLHLLEELHREHALSPHDCARLIKEIQFLLTLLPAQFYFSLDPSLYCNDPVQPVYAMSTGDFTILVKDLDEELFSDDRLNLLRITASSHFFLIEQVETILEYFTFEDDRVEAVRILYPQILDDENAYRLFKKFVFSNSKKELAKILQ